MRFILPLLAFVLMASPASSQVYKWTDPSGKTHYGDQPPQDAKKEEVKMRIQSYEGPAEVTDWGEILRRKPTAEAPRTTWRTGITMFSTEWCGHCKNARKYFAANGIAFTEVDIEKSGAGHKEYKELGGKGVPLILVGKKVMRGFSAESFEAMRR